MYARSSVSCAFFTLGIQGVVGGVLSVSNYRLTEGGAS